MSGILGVVLGGCAVPTPGGDFVSRGEVDEMIQEALAAADCLQRSEAETTYATMDAVLTLDGRLGEIGGQMDSFVRVLQDDDGDGGVVWVVDWEGNGDFTTIEDAIAALDAYQIPADRTLTISIRPGDYYPPSMLAFRHSDGGRVSVVGSGVTPDETVVHFPSSDGFAVRENSSLGYLSNLTLSGAGSTVGEGIQLSGSSSLVIGPMLIYGFVHGISVLQGSFLDGSGAHSVPGWLSVVGSASDGVYVIGGSSAELPYASVSGSDGHGFFVSGSSVLDATGAEAIGNLGAGFRVDSASAGFIAGGFASGNGGGGFEAIGGSSLLVTSGQSTDDGAGIVAQGNSYIDAGGVEVETDGFGFYAQSSRIDAVSTTVVTASYAFYANETASIWADGAQIDSAGLGFLTYNNSFIDAQNAQGVVTTDSDFNDVEDFVYGLD